MVAPSPDWFVGISGVTLRSGGVWLDDVVIDLDGEVDYPDDDGCSHPSDTTETVDEVSVPLMSPLGVLILTVGIFTAGGWNARRNRPHEAVERAWAFSGFRHRC